MKNLYQEQLMDHYRHPRNKGHLDNPDFALNLHNPSCGDAVAFEGKVHNATLVHTAFTGFGCVISQATASMLSEQVMGKTLQEILSLDKDFILDLIGGLELGPTRLRCALLPLQALQEGVKNYNVKQ